MWSWICMGGLLMPSHFRATLYLLYKKVPKRQPILSRYFGNRLKNKADFDNSRLTIVISKIYSKIIAAFVKPVICQLRVFISRNNFLWESDSLVSVVPNSKPFDYLVKLFTKVFSFLKSLQILQAHETLIMIYTNALLHQVPHYNHKQNIFRIY